MSEIKNAVNPETSIDVNSSPIKGKKKSNKGSETDKEAKSKEEKKPKMADLYEAIFAALTHCPTAYLPRPDFRVAIVKLHDVKTAIAISQANECKTLTLDQVAERILYYTRTTLAGHEKFRFTSDHARKCADYWQMASRAIPTPPHVRFKSDTEICWNRLPFDLQDAPTPLFDELFSRMKTNAEQIKAWIWSLFEPKAYLQQYIWIYGEGNDSKSSLLEFLAKCFGKEGALVQSKSPSGEHWGQLYPGKRFIFFPDFKDFSSLDNGPLKQITGGDRIYINPKNKPGYMASLECKLAFSSNHMPPLEAQRSNFRRIIFTEMSTTTDFDPDYAEKLWSEGGGFLRACKHAYEKLCAGHGRIQVSDDSVASLEGWASRTDDTYQLWFDDFFMMSSGNTLSPNVVTQRIEMRYRDYRSQRACYDWLRKKGYSKVQIREGKERRWIYRGLDVKPFNSSIP